MTIQFHKFHGAGNDFIMIDGRLQIPPLSHTTIAQLCNRRFGIGADGLIILKNHPNYDFEMLYYNADGHLGSMCGNGGRCAVQFAKTIGILKNEYSFLAADGPHRASIDFSNEWVNLKMKDIEHIEHLKNGAFFLDTGSPHYVQYMHNLKELDVYTTGKDIRNSAAFAPNGTNVNFVEIINGNKIYVRTFERGVEDETLSCGTGCTAAALTFAHNESGFNRVDVVTNGGSLAVDYEKYQDNTFHNIWLCGPAEQVFQGEVTV